MRGSTWTDIFSAFEDVKESVSKKPAAADPKQAHAVKEIQISDSDSEDSEEEG